MSFPPFTLFLPKRQEPSLTLAPLNDYASAQMSRFLLIAVLTAFTLPGWMQSSSPSRVSKPPEPQDQRGSEQSPLIIKQIPTQRTQAEVTQEEKDRSDKAANDTRLVIATFILGAVGVFQLVVFSIQSIYLRRTVEAAGEQSKAMERSIREANRLASAMEQAARDIATSAEAATESVAALRERTAQQMRAYLCVQVGGAVYQERNKNLKFEGKPLLVNTGHTPANKVSYQASAALLPVPLPGDFTFPLSGRVVGAAMMGPQQNAVMSAVVADFCEDGEVEIIKAGGPTRALYVWGIVKYEDIFDQQRQTRFCQSIIWLPDGKIFGYFTPGHNDGT